MPPTGPNDASTPSPAASSGARAHLTNFSRRFTPQYRRERKLPESMRSGFVENDGVNPEGEDISNPSPLGMSGTDTNSSLSSAYILRPPFMQRQQSHLHASSKNFKLPDLPWLCGTWHVTHSTLPMWKNKRNVRITYTRLPGNKLDDLVTYQNKDDLKLQKVAGIDAPKKDGSYVWRGKGMLKVASSKWEVLGWGGGGSPKNGQPTTNGEGAYDEPETTSAIVEDETSGEQWVVTFFAKTLFTPAGIDIYSRKQNGLSAGTLEKLQRGLMRIDGSSKGKPKTDFGRLVNQIFEVSRDDARVQMVEN